MKQKKILFYIDNPGQIGAMAATAEALQKRLDARIIWLLVDSKAHYSDRIAEFETYDFSILFRPLDELTASWLPSSLAQENALYYQAAAKRSPLRSWLIGARYKIRGYKMRCEQLQFEVSRRLNRWCISFSKLVKKTQANPSLRHVEFRVWRWKFSFSVTRVGNKKKSVTHVGDKKKSVTHVGNKKKKEWLYPRVKLWGAQYRSAGQTAFVRTRKTVQGFRYWYGATRSIRSFVQAIDPDLIILSEDNIETYTRIFVAYGAEQKIPSILLPTTIPNPLEAAQFYESKPGHQINNFLKRRLSQKKWHFKHGDKEMLRLPLHKILALEALGLSTPAPWILNRGSSVAIALDSEMQRDLYHDLGFPPEQLKVVGDMNGQVLFEGINNKTQKVRDLCKKYGLEPGRPLFLCAFPPDQYSSSNTSQFEYSCFRDMMEAWMDSFHEITDRANILIRPHPRLDPDQLARYSSARLKISTLPTVELVPLCDLYVASISATIRWAISCGIPTINYDCYRYKYGDFKSAGGVMEVDQLDDFKALLERFTSDPEFAMDLRAKQESVKSYWGMVDDKCSDRLSELARSVMEKTPSQSELR